MFQRISLTVFLLAIFLTGCTSVSTRPVNNITPEVAELTLEDIQQHGLMVVGKEMLDDTMDVHRINTLLFQALKQRYPGVDITRVDRDKLTDPGMDEATLARIFDPQFTPWNSPQGYAISRALKDARYGVYYVLAEDEIWHDRDHSDDETCYQTGRKIRLDVSVIDHVEESIVWMDRVGVEDEKQQCNIHVDLEGDGSVGGFFANLFVSVITNATVAAVAGTYPDVPSTLTLETKALEQAIQRFPPSFAERISVLAR